MDKKRKGRALYYFMYLNFFIHNKASLCVAFLGKLIESLYKSALGFLLISDNRWLTAAQVMVGKF